MKTLNMKENRKTRNKLNFCPDHTLVSLITLATLVLLFKKATLQDFQM